MADPDLRALIIAKLDEWGPIVIVQTVGWVIVALVRH